MYKTFSILIALTFFASCVTEEMIKVDPDFVLSFQRDGKSDALAGSTFYVINTGSGEFLTLFDGTAGHVWGEAGASGSPFDKADSLGVTYSSAGKYNLSIVSTSTSDFGNEVSRLSKTVEVNVVDERNSFSDFYINGVKGVFTPENEILFTFLDIVTDFNFKPVFVTNSEEAIVSVNGVIQYSDSTINDFKQPVVYTVKSSQGGEKNYTVKYTIVPSSDEKKITKFALKKNGNGENGVIDEESKTITVDANYGTNLTTKIFLLVESSFASVVTINNTKYTDRVGYDLKALQTIKVTAQNKTEANYSFILNAQEPVLQFTFIGLVPAPVGVIDNVAKTISVDVLKGTDITKLVAKWIGSVGTVQIGSDIQANGTTVNDFTTSKTYTFFKGSVAGDAYTVTVNVK